MNTVRQSIAIIPVLGMIVPEMGTKARQSERRPARTGLADVLFTPVQRRLLGLIFGQPERSFQSGELIRLAGSGTGAVHRLITRMADTGLVAVERIGNQKFYRANEDSPVFNELVALVRKTVGLAAPLQSVLSPFGTRIHAAFVYGSFARGEESSASDIDLLVIADDLEYSELYAEIPAVEALLARPVNPNLMTRKEWQRKRASRDSFAARVADQPKLFIIGSESDLE